MQEIIKIIQDYIDQLIKLDLPHRYAGYVNNLSSREILVIIIIAAVLILFMAYRKFGVGAVIGVILIYFFAYIIFYSNIFNNWQNDKMEEQRRMQIYSQELQKK